MPLVAHKHQIFLDLFSAYATSLVSSQSMLFPKSSWVCIPNFMSPAARVCLAKVPFLAFFLSDMNRGQRRVYNHINVLKMLPKLN